MRSPRISETHIASESVQTSPQSHKTQNIALPDGKRVPPFPRTSRIVGLIRNEVRMEGDSINSDERFR
jgi:hypothetical protein